MKKLEEVQGSKILVDTNVLVRCNDEKLKEEFRKVLRTLADNKNILSISTLTCFEILKKYTYNKDLIDYYVRLLNFLSNIPLDIEILNNAGIIANIYGRSKDENAQLRDQNDIIIGSTLFTTGGSYLLTCDKSGFFGSDFWTKIARRHICWEKEEVIKVENVFLLQFNDEVLHKKDASLR